MDAAAELGRNPVSKHQIQPEYGDGSRLTRDGTAEPVSRDQILRHARGQGNIIFPVQLTTSRIGNLTRLIHTLLCVMTIHTYIHTYILVSSPSDRTNLVSGYECGRVFPAGVGPGSPSRDAANWLPSQFSLEVETRRRYGWVMMVFPGTRLFQVPIWCPSGGVAARERQGALSRRAWYIALYRVGTHQIRRRRRAARSSTSQGGAEPLCARI